MPRTRFSTVPMRPPAHSFTHSRCLHIGYHTIQLNRHQLLTTRLIDGPNIPSRFTNLYPLFRASLLVQGGDGGGGGEVVVVTAGGGEAVIVVAVGGCWLGPCAIVLPSLSYYLVTC